MARPNRSGDANQSHEHSGQLAANLPFLSLHEGRSEEYSIHLGSVAQRVSPFLGLEGRGLLAFLCLLHLNRGLGRKNERPLRVFYGSAVPDRERMTGRLLTKPAGERGRCKNKEEGAMFHGKNESRPRVLTKQ